nr:hypothetical protein [Sporichthyaceae bacterium]
VSPTSLYEAAHHVFIGVAVAAALAFAALALVPRRTRPLVFDEAPETSASTLAS